VVGRIASRPGLAEQAYGEAEVFLIKAGMFMSGVRLNDSAFEGVGTDWKEDQGQFHYNPNASFGSHPTPRYFPTVCMPRYTGTPSLRSSCGGKRGRCTSTWRT
jgi:hypothetical protein